jgi:hypothetical protein
MFGFNSFVLLFLSIFHGLHVEGQAVTIYSPPSSYKIPRVLYARTLLLEHKKEDAGTILATWENYSSEPPYFPIYRSTDKGRTWSEISKVKDEVNGWGLRYQPQLFELPEDIGGFPAGTILLAGSAIPENLAKTQIDLYASTDRGSVKFKSFLVLNGVLTICSVTWKFISHVARGGKALPNNGETPVWEPFLMMYQHKLILYYSDQRDPKHGQKLLHQVTSDLRKWEAPVDDTAYPEYKARPGMTTVALLPNGKYIMTYEYCGAKEGGCPLHFRIAADPTKFNSAPDHLLRASDGNVPSGSPYVVWTPAGGPQGTIVVSSGGKPELFLNKNLGAPGSEWKKVGTSAPTSYTRSLLVLDDKRSILIVGGGVLNGKNNKVTASIFTIPG